MPDKLLLRPDCFLTYFETASENLHDPFEAYANTFLNDFNNKVVPQWGPVQIP
jgi:hypothetical protein